MMTSDEEELCRLLQLAAQKLTSVKGSIWSSYNSAADIANFVMRSKHRIEQGTFQIADKAELWGIFAPTCDWDDVVGDVELGNRVFELLERLYGSEVHRRVKRSGWPTSN